MPAVVKVKVIRARDLPIMDRSSELTDAFVEMRLAQGFQKTEVCHKTLNPQWVPNWYSFTVTDEELQDEPLQLKVMDHDMYSAHDAIGRVYVTPGSLVTGSTPVPLEGWFPIFDTLHGVRGELFVRVEVELIRDQHRFKHSSSEIKFFSGPGIPSSYVVTAIPGFVEELVVNDDPEYQWIDKIRTPRTSNEARQRLFLKLSGELQRRIGVKALEAGGNAIIGYSQSFDLEGESGIVVRGIGTCVHLSSSPAHLSSPTHPGHASSQQLNSSTSSGNFNESLRNAEDSVLMSATAGISDVIAPPTAPPTSDKGPMSLRLRKMSSSESEMIPASPSKADISALLLGTSSGSGGHAHLLPLGTYISSEFPFYTLRSFSRGFVKNLAGVVSARSVKLLDEINNPEEPETRDAWWREVRGEIKAHFRAMGCNAVIGYSEQSSICDSLCIFSATGTAAVVATDILESPLVTRQPPLTQAGSLSDVRVLEDEGRKGEGEIRREESFFQPTDDYQACSVCHIAYSTAKCPPDMKFLPCAVCRSKHVPSILLSTCEIPVGLLTRGKGCLVQARVCRYKKKLKGEDNASQVSKLFPFVEFQLHSRLINKMKVKGMNAIFGLCTQVAVGDTMLVAIATGTAVFVEALPAPGRLTFTGKVDSNPQLDVQNYLDQLQEVNRKQYSLFESQEGSQGGTTAQGLKRVDETGVVKERSRSPDSEVVEGDLFGGREKTVFVDVDDQQTKVDDLSELLSDHDLPQGFYISSLPYVPGVLDEQHSNSQMVTLLSRHIMDTKQSHSVEQQFGQLLDKALQGLLFTVRHIHPCVVTNVTFVVDLPDDDELQVFVVAMANSLVPENRPLSGGTKQAEERPIDQEDIFLMDGGGAAGLGDTHTMQTIKEIFLMSPLPYQAGYTTLHHLGIVNLFLIKESTSVKEFGGINSFLHTFVSEAHAMVRANVIALGGNGLLSYRLQQCVVIEHPHKNQAQCLLNVMGDAVLVSKDDEELTGTAQSPLFPSSTQLLELVESSSYSHRRTSLNTTDTQTVSIQTEQNLATI